MRRPDAMAADVIMPALGVAQETGKVLRWLRRQGEAVTKGEPLAEIETDKATVELEAPDSGLLADVCAAEGDSVPVGQVIARITAPGDADGLRVSETACTRARVAASPKARRLAQARGVDLAAVAGSGPGGAVLAGDVMAAAAVGLPRRATVETARLSAAPASVLSTTWRLMAERTARAWTTVPHFFLLREADASRLLSWRRKHRERFDVHLTPTDLLVKVAAAALRRHPGLNARWEQGAVARVEAINIGLAVATEDGLVVPVIHDADRLRVNEIAARRRDVVERAHARTLRPPDLRDGTFTISNLGMYGVDAFTAVINTPEAAILAVGRIADRVVARDGRPVVRPMVMLSLSCDHRAVDGARAAQFLGTLVDLVEEPAGLID